MAIEVKGLQETLASVRKSIAAVRNEVAGLGKDTADLHKTLIAVRAQINQVHDDLKFEAENLGNNPVQDVMQRKEETHKEPPRANVVAMAPGPSTNHGSSLKD